MAKLLENTFRHMNIALVNEMLRFCDELDIDLWDAIDCTDTKPFGFMAFRPGPGVEGHCIPVDPTYLSHRVKARLGYAFRMVELAEEINEAAPSYVAWRVWRALNDAAKPVKGSRILLLGVTYKANIADDREGPAGPLAIKLLGWGAHVFYHDPLVSEWRPRGSVALPFRSESDAYTACSQSDLVVLLQRHSDYDLATIADHGVTTIDTRGVLPSSPMVIRI